MTTKKVDEVSVLDEDLGFAGALDEKSLGLARRYATASVVGLKRGSRDRLVGPRGMRIACLDRTFLATIRAPAGAR